jgi:carboxylesterase
LLIGFSMGSLLALRLAAEHPRELVGLCVLGVPIEHPRWQLAASRLLADLSGRAAWLAKLIGHRKKADSDVRDKAVVDRRAALRALPYPTIVEFGALQDQARAALSRVTTPTLLLHGAYDHVADVDGSARVSQALGASDVARIVLPHSFHHLVRDVDSEQVCARVLEFGDRLHAQLAGRALAVSG